MATVVTRKIVITYVTEAGTSRVVTIGELKANLQEEAYDDIINTLVTNNALFEPKIVSPKSAKFVTTTTEDVGYL